MSNDRALNLALDVARLAEINRKSREELVASRELVINEIKRIANAAGLKHAKGGGYELSLFW